MIVDFLLNRTTVISLAVLGGVLSLLASWCANRQIITSQHIAWLNKAAYVCMITSIVLFIGAGFFNRGN